VLDSRARCIQVMMMMTLQDTTQGAPGTTEAHETLTAAVRRYKRAIKLPYPSRASAERAAERQIYRLIKAQQQRGALVFVQIGPALLTFDNDAVRVARVCGIAECRVLRLRRASCDGLLATLRERAIEVVIVKIDTL